MEENGAELVAERGRWRISAEVGGKAGKEGKNRRSTRATNAYL